jgi:hypothetical protein
VPPAQASRRNTPARQQVPDSVLLAAQSARAVQQSAGHGSFAPYQAVVLTEFIAASLLVAATPIATRKNQPGLSPYRSRDMSKLLAIGGVYFLLELLAVTGRGPGRFAAWAGGLVLLVTGMGEAADISDDLDLLGRIKSKVTGKTTAGTSSGAGGQFT